MKNRRLFALLTVLSAFFAAECQRSSVQSTGDAQPVREVLAAGRAPVEMGAVTPMLVSAGAPTFSVKVRNVTDAPLDSILWTVVPFDRAGNIIPDGDEEGGYADPLNPIGPGEASELSFMVSSAEAARVKLVLREVIFISPNPLGRDYPGLPQKWTNPYFDAELRTVRGIGVPE